MIVNVTGREPVQIRATDDLLVEVYDTEYDGYGALNIIDELEGTAAGVGPNEIDGLIFALLKARSLVKYGHIGTARQWRPWECWLMGWLDFRYWFCDCHYWPPYGRVISADCEKHD